MNDDAWNTEETMGHWTDTTNTPPPRYGDEATWLVGRFPDVQRLLARISDTVWFDDEDVAHVDLEQAAAAVRSFDEHRAARDVWERRNPAPRDDAAYEEWLRLGPQAGTHAHQLAVMSETERNRIRLLAVLSGAGRTALSVADLSRFDDSGRAFVRDWCALVAA